MSRQDFDMLAYADKWLWWWRKRGNADDLRRARRAERAGLVCLAQANGSLGLFAETWTP
jgi:hypothetical protein